MARLLQPSRFITLALAMILGIAINTPVPGQAQLRSSSLRDKLEDAFRPPDTTATPQDRQGAASRGGQGAGTGGECQAEKPPILLVPANGGRTIAEHPTVFWYMPSTSALSLEFVLQDDSDNVVYSTQYELAKSTKGGASAAGLMSLTIPASASVAPLKIGQTYHWSLALICDALNRSKDTVVEGEIKRVAPNPTLALKLQQATPQERIALYADNQLWYETVKALVELRRDRPNDVNLADAWNTLLNSVGLGTIVQEPLFQDAVSINN
ncbi:MAG TPA: DUF928 domain-containing protein [Cyanophyceae cyanobacterium]